MDGEDAAEWDRLGIAERKVREKANRERRIVAAATTIAEREGWPAVTIRRLADEIEHSQPVLYSHFASRDAIVAAVAVEGFRELASALRPAAAVVVDDRTALENVALAYLAFAHERPALYEAMFIMPNGLRFAETDTRPELKEAFATLVAALAPVSRDVDVAAETFWAALHGLAALERSDRIRSGPRVDRVTLLVDVFAR